MKVLEDPASLAAYSADASLFQMMPKQVWIPETEADLFTLVKMGRSLTPRGGATSTTGAPLGDDLVIDLSVHLNKILDFNKEERTVTVQPGIVLDVLNAFLKPHGLKFGPETSTGSRATIGGMIGNNAAGSSSLLYGTTANALVGVSLLLSSGEVVKLTPEEPLTQKLHALGEKYRPIIEKHFPPMQRRVSGYALDTLLENPLKIVAGSEGTLGILLEVTLSLVPLEKDRPLHLYHFSTLQEALEAVPLFENASLLELLDNSLLVEANTLPFPPTNTFEGEKKRELLEQRRSKLEKLFSRRSYEGPCGFLEDVAVPPKLLAPFMAKFIPLLEKRFGETAVYGHAGAGCLHIRPYVDLRIKGNLELVLQTMREATELLKEVGGSLSGEHGDGWLRSWLNGDLYGEEIVEVFKELKQLFDPLGMMNPGKIIPAPFPIDKLKKTLPLKGTDPKTFLNFIPEGGITLAADLCNGNGLCRKKGGFMCPSFQVTGEEVDGPRGRAQAIRRALHDDDLSDPSLQGVLNRCLSCKGCQIECPSHVDIAKMKAEALYRHQKKYGVPLRSRMIGYLPNLLPYLPAWASSLEIAWIKKLFGFAPDRSLPKKVSIPFSKRTREKKTGEPVALFVDTFTEWFEPEVGEATVSLLEYLGYSVELISGFCCGRTAYSKGLLPHARKELQQLGDELTTKNIPVIGIEPTCVTMAQDDGIGLLQKTLPLLSLEAFLHALPLAKRESGKVLLHVHCHRKASAEAGLPLAVLKKVMGDAVSEIPSGCCGMAGSFGYEIEHADLSREVADLILLPTLEKNPEARIVGTGFSCRSQLRELTGRRIDSLPTLLCDLFNLKYGGKDV